MLVAEAAATYISNHESGEGDLMAPDIDGILVFQAGGRCSRRHRHFDRKLPRQGFCLVFWLDEVVPEVFLA